MAQNEYLFDTLSIINNVFSNGIDRKDIEIGNIPFIKSNLFQHQKALVQGMYLHYMKMKSGFVWNNQIIRGKLGIIGDPPGSGKSLSILSYISLMAQYNQINNPTGVVSMEGELVPSSNRYFYSNTIETITDISSTNLIIVPTHLFSQWKGEIEKHTTMAYVPIENKRILRNNSTPGLIAGSKFVLTTNKMYRTLSDYAANCNIRWKNVFIDEAAHIYFPGNDPQLQFEFLWLISSNWVGFMFKNMWISPSNLLYIQDRLESLHPDTIEYLTNYDSVKQNINTQIVSSSFFKTYVPFGHNARWNLVVKNTKNNIKNSFNIPERIYQKIECRYNTSLNTLRQMSNLNINDSKIPTIFKSLNIASYNVNELISIYPAKKELIEIKVEDDCSICLDKPVNKVLATCCMNSFCGKCILRHLLTGSRCATCRAENISITDIAYIPSEDQLISLGPLLNRHETCLDYIIRHPNETILIYTSYENTFYQLLPELQRKGIQVDKLDSNTLNASINAFNSGVTKALFLSDISLIHGLNLMKTQHLVFFYEQPFYEERSLLISSVERMNRSMPLTIVDFHCEELQ